MTKIFNYNTFKDIIMFNKKQRFTSYDIVKKFKRILLYKKIGHCGTLDFLASGLIILFIGNTKIIKNFTLKNKRYLVFAVLGLLTNSNDMDGKIKFYEKNFYFLDKNIIKYNLCLINKQFFYTPPLFSSIKHNGIRLYNYARFEIKIKLKRKHNKIFKIKLFYKKDNLIILDMTCESGTYVRGILHFLSKKINVPICASIIHRISIGNLRILDSFSF